MSSRSTRILLPLFAASLAWAAHADDSWVVRVGAVNVAPDASSEAIPLVGAGSAVDVEDATSLGINFTYKFDEHWGLDILGAYPFEHDIVGAGTIAALGKVGSTKQLPPTFSLQYQFRPGTAFRPYVGLGFNYTTFFSEEGAGPVTSLALDDSFGLAYQVGADIGDFSGWFINLDVRMIDIETTATTNLGNFDVTIDPLVIGINVGTRF